MTADYNHENDDKLEQAQEIVNAPSDQRANLCAKYGFSSLFEVNATVANAQRGETGEIPLACYAIGDIAITAAPFEMFCQTEKQLREDSPFSFTFTCGYSNDSQSYMPAAECFENQGYEVVVCHYVKGTAELISETQLGMLNELHAAS